MLAWVFVVAFFVVLPPPNHPRLLPFEGLVLLSCTDRNFRHWTFQRLNRIAWAKLQHFRSHAKMPVAGCREKIAVGRFHSWLLNCIPFAFTCAFAVVRSAWLNASEVFRFSCNATAKKQQQREEERPRVSRIHTHKSGGGGAGRVLRVWDLQRNEEEEEIEEQEGDWGGRGKEWWGGNAVWT